jgi:hypothetical protein
MIEDCDSSTNLNILTTRGNGLRVDGKIKDALPLFDSAIREYQNLVAREPENVDWARDLAASATYRGDCWAALGHWDDAIRNYELAAGVVRRLVDTDPKNVRLKLTFGVTLLRDRVGIAARREGVGRARLCG